MSLLGSSLLSAAEVVLVFGKCRSLYVCHQWLVLGNNNSDANTDFMGLYFGMAGVAIYLEVRAMLKCCP